MNYSISSLILGNHLINGPFIAYNNNISLYNSHFHRFSVPVTFATLFLRIERSLFHHFIEQVVKQSKTENNILIYRCNSFKNINSDSNGCIFSLESKKVEVSHCSFERVASSSFPACFMISNSQADISYCYFDSCYAQGGNKKFGNAFYCSNSDIQLKCTYTKSCAPSHIDQDIVGDSAIALCYSLSLHISHLNSSKCYGETGAAAVSFRESTCSESFLSFVTILDPHDCDCLETQNSKQKSFIYYTNIVNSSSCLKYILCNTNSNLTVFRQSVFINPHTVFASKIDIVELDNCYSNDISSISVTSCDLFKTAKVGITFYEIPICKTCGKKREFGIFTIRNIIKSNLFILLIIGKMHS